MKPYGIMSLKQDSEMGIFLESFQFFQKIHTLEHIQMSDILMIY